MNVSIARSLGLLGVQRYVGGGERASAKLATENTVTETLDLGDRVSATVDAKRHVRSAQSSATFEHSQDDRRGTLLDVFA